MRASSLNLPNDNNRRRRARSSSSTGIAASGLGEVALGGFTAPADQAAALALVNQVAPSLAGIGWTVRSTERGSYVFYASGTKGIPTGKGTVNTALGALATVTVGADGKATVSVLVGTGASAKLVK